MARCEEEFNPWPSFVDIFSSVILVLLLFLLITIVNIGYYAQFKHKVSYTGSISTDEVILSEKAEKNKQEEEREISPETIENPVVSQTNPQKKIQQLQEQIEQIQKEIQQSQVQFTAKTDITEETDKKGEIESTGYSLGNEAVGEKTKQTFVEGEDYYIASFSGKEIFVDSLIRRNIKNFLQQAKQKKPNHKVRIYTVDKEDAISATIAKQISLGRSLAIRNFIRKLGYNKKDVRIDLNNTIDIKTDFNTTNGYLIIKIDNQQ